MIVLLDSYPESNYSTPIPQSNSIPNQSQFVGQVFYNENEVTLDSCKFYLYKKAGLTGLIYAQIYAITGTPGINAVPTGSVLATSDAFQASNLSESIALETFSFTGAERIILNASTHYALILNVPLDPDAVYNGADDTTLTHSGNLIYSGPTPGWNGTSSYDDIFYIYGDDGSTTTSTTTTTSTSTTTSTTTTSSSTSSSSSTTTTTTTSSSTSSTTTITVPHDIQLGDGNHSVPRLGKTDDGIVIGDSKNSTVKLSKTVDSVIIGNDKNSRPKQGETRF